jgi:hypothetical protein
MMISFVQQQLNSLKMDNDRIPSDHPQRWHLRKKKPNDDNEHL